MRNKLLMFVMLLVAILLAQPKLSYADWDRDHRHHEEHHYYRYHEHPHFGLRVSIIPDGCFSISLGRLRYYYYDGLYYSRAGGDYVIVNPPVGAVVSTIPAEYQPVVINGVTYYSDNGIYYVYTQHGYQVVPQPATMVIQTVPNVQASTQIIATSATSTSDESFTVNIPNDKGEYTAVVIKRSGNGFVGPQGEFYAEFPRVSQLKVMYTK